MTNKISMFLLLSVFCISANAVETYPPHGYPCLGCHPCPGEVGEYCDDNSLVISQQDRENFEILTTFQYYPNGTKVRCEKIIPTGFVKVNKSEKFVSDFDDSKE
jgi:hypothetical protein